MHDAFLHIKLCHIPEVCVTYLFWVTHSEYSEFLSQLQEDIHYMFAVT
jgi:hypothetical protein